MPLMKIRGTNTATVVSEELSMGVITSPVPTTQARRSEYPRSRYCEMFSVTMMQLSIIMPRARISPEREMMFRDMPNR